MIPTSARAPDPIAALRRADDVLAWAPSGRIAVPLIVVLVVVADLVGVGTVTLLLLGVSDGGGDAGRGAVLLTALAYLLLALPAATLAGLRRQRATTAWLAAGRAPTAAEAARTLRLPVDTALLAGLVWLAGAVLVGVVAALTFPEPLVGGLATLLTARAVGRPLRDLRRAVQRVGAGDYTAAVTVDDAGEIGLLQEGVNTMAAGLAERERLRDLFGRHVGTTVAARALAEGASLGGEVRPVAALFVDIAGSTALVRRTGPEGMVGLLNRFFAVVVDAVEAEGGLVDKFEGDAALCVFGAPAEHPDPSGAALRAARRICDEVARAGEVDVGVGVACGPVWAGQVGTARRLEYTVIGDPVNEAARLTELAKDRPGRVVASEAAVRGAGGREAASWVPDAEVVLRGRGEPTRTYVRANT